MDKIFRYLVFLNPRTAPVWLITALWDRNFSKENRVTAHLCIKTIGAPNLLIHWRFPHENFWHCETINSDKTVMPPTLHENFRYHVFFRNTEGFPYEFFRHCETKINQQKILMLFPLLLHPIFFKSQKASETTKGSRMKFFSPVRQKVFEKSVILRPMHQKFLCQIFFWKQKNSPTNFLGVMKHKEFFDRNVMSPPPTRALLCMTIFGTRSFLKCRCVPLRDLSLVWKKVQRWMVKTSCDA